MITAYFRFTGELNDFLSRPNRDNEIRLSFAEHQSVKHLIESLGVPHVEVGKILASGMPVEEDYRLKNGDRIEVQPAAPGCPSDPRFLADSHLGRLAAYLRMLGFDCLYENDFEDGQMAAMIEHDERILLTRDRRLLMRNAVRFGYCLRSLDPLDQLTEVMQRFELKNIVQPFHRCLRCNHLLEPVEKEVILDRLQPLTKQYFDEFHICPNCGQIYWKGSHFEKMLNIVNQINQSDTL